MKVWYQLSKEKREEFAKEYRKRFGKEFVPPEKQVELENEEIAKVMQETPNYTISVEGRR